MDFYLLGAKNGWTWADWQDTPDIVKRLCWTYMQMEAEVTADRAKAAS